ncbi:SufD family Fe-S cluster assembly protein [Candidatus Woesebacteria bacterium]|nr:SufD family Fe-S cluster assembly protein [Candidatus Woesebacteria bacterium]
MKQLKHITKSGNKKIHIEAEGAYVVFLDNVSGIFTFEILASGVHIDIYGVYVGKQKDTYNLHTIQHHKAPNSTSNLLIKSVLYGESKFNYHGLIRIDANCNGSHAYQKNQNLILSNKAQVLSEPDLEILSNEVFCTHGSTTGKPSSDQMYYLQTRGLSPELAQETYVNGFLEDVTEKISSS